MANRLKKYSGGFTTIDNSILKGTKLSPKAIGIWVQLLSLPQNWKFSKKGLQSIINAGERSIDSGLKELEKAGLFHIRKVKPTKNEPLLHYDYSIFEKPNFEEIKRQIELEKEEFGYDDIEGYQDLHNVDLDNVALHNVDLHNAGTYKESNNKTFNNKKLNNSFKEKNNKKRKKSIPVLIKEMNLSLELENSLLDFAEFRKDINAKLTERGLTLLMNNLNKLSNSNNEKIDIINQSIMNGWKGVFPLRNKPKQFNMPTNKDYSAQITEEEIRMYNE